MREAIGRGSQVGAEDLITWSTLVPGYSRKGVPFDKDFKSWIISDSGKQSLTSKLPGSSKRSTGCSDRPQFEPTFRKARDTVVKMFGLMEFTVESKYRLHMMNPIEIGHKITGPAAVNFSKDGTCEYVSFRLPRRGPTARPKVLKKSIHAIHRAVEGLLGGNIKAASRGGDLEDPASACLHMGRRRVPSPLESFLGILPERTECPPGHLTKTSPRVSRHVPSNSALSKLDKYLPAKTGR